MKIVILYFLLVVGGFTNAFSQTDDWPPIGAKWVYGYSYCGNTPLCGIVVHEIEKDTIVSGIQCKSMRVTEVLLDTNQLSEGVHYELQRRQFLFENSGATFLYDPFNDEFFKLFDFNLQLGDTLVLADVGVYRGFPGGGNYTSQTLSPPYDSTNCGPMVYYIDSDSVVSIAGKQRVYQEIGYVHEYKYGFPSEVVYGGIIIEEIGPIYHGFFGSPPDYSPGGFYSGNLLCYSESGHVIYEGVPNGCSLYLDTRDKGSHLFENNEVKAYPNPSGNHIVFDIPSAIQEEADYLVIRSLEGQEILHISLNGASRKMLDVADLLSGLYVVEVCGADGLLGRAKFVKQ